MSTPTIDVLGIGNALVDVLTPVTEQFLAEQDAKHGMVKESMNLIDEARAIELYALMGQGTEMSGGSVANSIAHVAALGGKAAYIGKVADDQLGEIYRHDMRSMGVTFTTQPLVLGAKTGRSLILVSDDATRTMNTYLGAATELRVDDIDPELIMNTNITLLEGYLFDKPHSKQAFYAAGHLAHQAGRRIALSLSDFWCVERHHGDFTNLIDEHVDVLFANETEILVLFETKDLQTAINAIRRKCDIVALTLGSKGSMILAGDQTINIPAVNPSALVDTTGAGDAYAGGFLYGLTAGKPLAECGAIASKNAASVLSYMGPRPLYRAA